MAIEIALGEKKGKATETLPLRVTMREASWKIYIHGFNELMPTGNDDRTHYNSVRDHYMRSFSNPRVHGRQHWSRAISELTEDQQHFFRLTIFPLLSVYCSGGTTSEEAIVAGGTKRKAPEVSDIVYDFRTDPQMLCWALLAGFLQAEASETINMTA